MIADFETNGSGQLVTQDNQYGAPSSMPVLQTFEVFLDLSDLSRAGYTQMPSIDGTGDMALQFKTDSYTDGFVSGSPAPPLFPNPRPLRSGLGPAGTWAGLSAAAWVEALTAGNTSGNAIQPAPHPPSAAVDQC